MIERYPHVARIIRHPATLGATVLAAAALAGEAPAVADDVQPVPPAEPTPALISPAPAVIDTPAYRTAVMHRTHVLNRRQHHGKNVPIDGNHDILWIDGARQGLTAQPVAALVMGNEQYWREVVTNGRAALKPIPADQVQCALTGDYALGPDGRAGSQDRAHFNGVLTKRARIFLNHHSLHAMARVRLVRDGHVLPSRKHPRKPVIEIGNTTFTPYAPPETGPSTPTAC